VTRPFAALYVRVSTDEQELEGQRRALESHASRQGWLVARVYAEKISGTGRAPREAHAELLRDAAAPGRAFDHVLVLALDRWSRETQFTAAIGSIEALEASGVEWHSVREPLLDTGASEGTAFVRDILRGILPAIASFEARRRSENTRVAMQELASGRRPTRSGRPVGRPRKVTPELAQKAYEIRYSTVPPVPWRKVATQVHLPAETCRKAARALRGASAGETRIGKKVGEGLDRSG
jgi:DNA invertase Pin-like site-specific DNA recombinase